MTPLHDIIAVRIRAGGPMSLAEYMATCLLHPEHGYYATRDPFGSAGDFTTAPEISQMFGELVGLSLAQAWLDAGRPAPFRLVELGPGRGTLMADALRAAARVPGFVDTADLHLVEASPALRDRQARTISRPLVHHERLQDVPSGPILLIANEFFDALPIRQFVRTGDGWHERVVGLRGGRLHLGLTDLTRPPFLDHRLGDTEEGDIVEVSSAAQSVAAEIGRRISREGGVALIVDYGDWRSLGDTFQAVRGHRRADPFEAPGTADLTAHVDFEALAIAASPAAAAPPVPQGVFLERLGITERAKALAEGLSGDALEDLVSAHRRLTHPEEMGTLFKVMALHQAGSPPPPGVTA